MEQTTVNKRYRVDRRIGEGGMADVYLGHDLLLNRPVAIKALHARYVRDPGFRSRFEREAPAAAGLNHPNIIEIYDVGEEGGAPYIVMEFVDGQTLKEVIEQEGPFDPDDVAALLEQVASALDYAHERGVIHRDVKPQNILVDRHGLARVVDFGIAQGLSDSALTDVGIGLGTVHYVSPEQANGLMATPASDIYSLGIIAFEMLTGHLPFNGETPVSVALQHIEEPPPLPSAYQPYLPPSVDHIVHRALAKNPTLRYRSAGSFAAAMANWREGAFDGLGANDSRASMPSPGSATAVIAPRLGERDAARMNSRPASDDLAASPGLPRDAVGPGTWIAGIAVLIALLLLVWFGAYISEGRFGAGHDTDPTITAPLSAPAAAHESTGAVEAPDPSRTAPSSGPGPVTVPRVIGMDLSGATNTLTSIGLLVSEGQPVYDQQVPAGLIAEQDPPIGTTVERGQSVVVKVSLGSPEVNLASLELAGRPAEEARALLRERGLNVDVEETDGAGVEKGHVVRVDPETSAMIGDTVTLFVSRG